MPIRTDRVELRVIEDCDPDEIHAILGDPDTAGNRSFFQPDPASTKQWIARRRRDQAEHGFSTWGAGLLPTGKLVALTAVADRAGFVVERAPATTGADELLLLTRPSRSL